MRVGPARRIDTPDRSYALTSSNSPVTLGCIRWFARGKSHPVVRLVRSVLWLPLLVLVVGCGCAASPERRDEPMDVKSEDLTEAWGARFALPEGWTGGENDAGGFEFTDGDVALLVGRHPLTPDKSLEDFMTERARVLAELGAGASGEPRREQVRGSDVMTLAAAEDSGVAVRLLVARLGPAEGLSLMMVGEAGSRGKLDEAWARVVRSLTLP